MSKLENIVGKTVKFIEFISTKKAADFTFYMFQRTQPRKMLADEVDFYNSTEFISIPSLIEPIRIYTKGPEDGELFILLHGWNSNLARLADIVSVLVSRGYRCVLFDMPGHGKSKLKRTNLKVNSIVFKTVLEYLNPKQKFNVLTHSFGSMVASYTLADTNYSIDRLIYLTVLDRFEPIFIELKKRLNLSQAVYDLVVEKAEKLLGEPITNLEMLERTKRVNFKRLSLFHDKYDKILPVTFSQKLATGINNTKLFEYERIGHSRMLQNKQLLQDLEGLISE